MTEIPLKSRKTISHPSISFTSGVNYVIRKMAGMAKPATEIKVFDGKIHLYTFAMGLFKREDAFALNEEFEREHQGVKSNVSAKDIYSQLQLR